MENFRKFWKILEILENFRKFWRILENFSNFGNFRILGMILHYELKPFSKLVDDDDDENVSTYKILGSLKILAIKK